MIPKRIYQSWKTKELSPNLQANVDEIKRLNPTYEYVLFDDNDCRDYLLKNYGVPYASAFDNLFHGAFKCDFWRYAILAKEGGIYVDIDMVPLVPFDEIIRDTDELVSVVDRKRSSCWPDCGIFQSFLAGVKNHQALINAFLISFVNITNQKIDLSTSRLDLTGPVVMGRALNIAMNKANSIQIIEPGVYGNIRLFSVDDNNEHTYEGDKRIFINKTVGYQPENYYFKSDNFYNLPQFKSEYYSNPGNYLIVYVVLQIVILMTSWSLKTKIIASLLALGTVGFLGWRKHRYIMKSVQQVLHVKTDSNKDVANVRTRLMEKNPTSRVYVWSPELLKWYNDDEDILKSFGGKFI